MPRKIIQINSRRNPNFAVRVALIEQLPTVVTVLRRRTTTVKSDKMA
jgi:hypothetical protein